MFFFSKYLFFFCLSSISSNELVRPFKQCSRSSKRKILLFSTRKSSVGFFVFSSKFFGNRRSFDKRSLFENSLRFDEEFDDRIRNEIQFEFETKRNFSLGVEFVSLQRKKLKNFERKSSRRSETSITNFSFRITTFVNKSIVPRKSASIILISTARSSKKVIRR